MCELTKKKKHLLKSDFTEWCPIFCIWIYFYWNRKFLFIYLECFVSINKHAIFHVVFNILVYVASNNYLFLTI